MERLYARNSVNGAQVAGIVAGLVISIAIGIAIASERFFQFQVLMLLFLVPIFIICFFHPPVSIYVFFFWLIVFGTAQPGIKIFGVNLLVGDLLFLLIVPAILMHLNDKKTDQREELKNPFILVCIFVVFTFVLGLARSNYSTTWFNYVIHPFVYMIIVYFWTTLVLDTKSKMKRLAYILLIAAIIAGLKAMLIAASGATFSSFVSSFDVSLQVRIGGGVGATRVILAGADTFFPLLVPIVAAFFFTPNRWLKIIAVVSLPFITVGIIISYTRTNWISAAAGLLFVLIYLVTVKRGKNILKVTVIALFVFVIVLVLLTYGNLGRGNLGEAALERYMRQPLFGGESLSDPSIIARIDESKVALESLGVNIVFGKGMGATYHFYLPGYESDVTGWSHNGFVWLMLMGGIFGTLIFLMALFIASRRLIAYRGDVDLRAISIGLVGSMVTFLFLSLATNRFSSLEGASFVGLYFGFSWIIYTSRSW